MFAEIGRPYGHVRKPPDFGPLACNDDRMLPDFDRCYRAAEDKDARFDGWIYCGVTSTGIYCRPSCPARTPKRTNLRFYSSAAAAQAAGFRACKRCRPDATPGSPEWDASADLVGRAMRLIADGVVDREGVGGLARRLGYSERHVNRQLVERAGAGPLAIARSNRAQNARILLETTSMPAADVAHAAGFASVRQFNDTVREVFADTPTGLRGRAPGAATRQHGERTAVELAIPFREPFALDELIAFLAARAVDGVEAASGGGYARVLALPTAPGRVTIASSTPGRLRARFELGDARDLGPAVERVRRLFDLDSDPVASDAALSRDATLSRSVKARPGLRVAGCVDGAELAIRAVLGQQVTVKSATRMASRLAAEHGKSTGLPAGDGLPDKSFPSAATIAELDPSKLPMPRRRASALKSMAVAIADGSIQLDGAADRAELRAKLQSIPGIGPWTAGYVAMRALRDPDVFLTGDSGARAGMAALNLPDSGTEMEAAAARWSPYRSYALQHLWLCAARPTKARKPT